MQYNHVHYDKELLKWFYSTYAGVPLDRHIVRVVLQF